MDCNTFTDDTHVREPVNGSGKLAYKLGKMSVSHFVTFRTTCRDAREYHIAYLTAKLLYEELCHTFGNLQVIAAILVVIDNLTVKNCVHSYVLDA